MKSKFIWKKCPSVRREGKFFYYCAENRKSISQDWKTDKWHIHENLQNYSQPFDTVKEAMQFVEDNY